MEIAQIKQDIKDLREKSQAECKQIYKEAKEKTASIRLQTQLEIDKLKEKESELKKNRQAKDSFVHTRIDSSLSEKLKERAETSGVSTSDYVRSLIEASLKN
ncbi:MAG: hypothetical protein ABUK01_06750 [Leptospirales bacterium]